MLLLGTLADLKKHRAQSRYTTHGAAITNGNGGGNGSLTPSAEVTSNGGASIVTATTTATTTTGTANGYMDELDGNGAGKIPIELSLISPDDYASNGGGGGVGRGGELMSSNSGGGNGAVSLSNGSTKFSGIITGDVVSDSTRSKRCCVVM